MAQYAVTYTADGRIKHELTYKEQVFSFTMIPDTYGKTGDKKCFEYQVEEKFPNESDEVMEAIEELSFADEYEIEEYLSVLSAYED